MTEDEHEKKLKQEVLEALRWATRSLELGGTVEDTMTGFIVRLQNGDEWFREPVMHEEPALDCCKVCGKHFDDPLSIESMMEVAKAKKENEAIYPARVCADCYNKMDIRSPYKASMN